jgi:hypothetical protein
MLGEVMREQVPRAMVPEHAAPWLSRRLRKVSSGDGLPSKRPELLPLSNSGDVTLKRIKTGLPAQTVLLRALSLRVE